MYDLEVGNEEFKVKGFGNRRARARWAMAGVRGDLVC